MISEKLRVISNNKYNSWCERRPLVSKRSQVGIASVTNSELSQREKAAFYFHEMTGCMGFEFVAFSDARFSWSVFLSNSVILVPCFLDSLDGTSMTDPIAKATMKMQKNARFVYDGWIPIEEWEETKVRNKIRGIDEAFSTFALFFGISAEWEPKYYPSIDAKPSFHVEDSHINEIERLSQGIDSLNEKDRLALYRSLGWFSQGLRISEPAARFLFLILAIESLGTYIEREANEDSLLREKLGCVSLTKAERRVIREECIHETLSSLLSENPTKAVQEAYFHCVSGIRKLLIEHIEHVSKSNAEAIALLFEPKDGSLYDLRNKIAHGGPDTLSEIERDRIRKRLWDAEQIARRYLLTVISDALGVQLEQGDMTASVFISPRDMIPSGENMYKGRRHMALFYAL